MQRKNSAEAATLESAFNTFNALSAQLAESYQALELRVASLTEELNQARSERMQQLGEKERINNRMAQLLELLPGGVIVLDGNGLVTDCNPAALKLLGRPLMGMFWHDVINRAFAPKIDEGSEVNLKNGKRVSISSQSLGQEPGQIVLITDVTEQHALQDLVNRHYRLSAMGEMAASLAHQIRTPLATAILYTSHLGRPTQTDEERAITLDKVVSRLRYLDHMVNDMLQFARSGSFDMDSVPLGKIIEGVLLSAESLVQNRNGEIDVSGRYQNTFVYGNGEALQGALLNIVTNAIQVTGENVKIRISVSHTRTGRVRLSIRDNGPGIDKESMPELFTPFFTTRPDGTGLGLAVANTIVETHKGTIRVESRPGRGANFIIELPKAREQEMLRKATRAVDTNNSQPADSRAAGQRKVS